MGSNLIFCATKKQYSVFGVSRSVPIRSSRLKWIRCDLSEKGPAHRCLNQIAPDIIVHAAAMTNVDACEKDPELAERQNVLASSNLAEWAHANKSFLLYVSTDSVFDGARGRYSEEDAPGPLNAYARSKLMGEEVVRAVCPHSLILRTNLYGWNFQDKLSLGEWILRGLLQKETLGMFTDVYFAPLYAGDLAQIILELVNIRAKGVYHAGASDACSKHAFSVLLADIFVLDATSIAPTSVVAFPFAAKRPQNTTLRVEKISNLLGHSMPTIEDGVRKFHDSLRTGFVESLKGHLPGWLMAYCNE